MLLCSIKPCKAAELATLIKRTVKHVRDYHLTPMVEEGLMELLYPDKTVHPDQAYKTKKALKE